MWWKPLKKNRPGHISKEPTLDNRGTVSLTLSMFQDGARQGNQALSCAPPTEESLHTKQLFQEPVTTAGMYVKNKARPKKKCGTAKIIFSRKCLNLPLMTVLCNGKARQHRVYKGTEQLFCEQAFCWFYSFQHDRNPNHPVCPLKTFIWRGLNFIQGKWTEGGEEKVMNLISERVICLTYTDKGRRQ